MLKKSSHGDRRVIVYYLSLGPTVRRGSAVRTARTSLGGESLSKFVSNL